MLWPAVLNAVLVNAMVLFWAFTFAYCYFAPETDR